MLWDELESEHKECRVVCGIPCVFQRRCPCILLFILYGTPSYTPPVSR